MPPYATWKAWGAGTRNGCRQQAKPRIGIAAAIGFHSQSHMTRRGKPLSRIPEYPHPHAVGNDSAKFIFHADGAKQITIHDVLRNAHT